MQQGWVIEVLSSSRIQILSLLNTGIKMTWREGGRGRERERRERESRVKHNFKDTFVITYFV